MSRFDWQPVSEKKQNIFCVDRRNQPPAQTTYTTAVKRLVYSHNHNHHIYQTPQARRIITYSAVFKSMPFRLWLQIQRRNTIVSERQPFIIFFSRFLWIIFSFLMSNLKLDSLLINYNYLANDVHSNALWCFWLWASDSRSQKLIQTCHR